MISEEEHRAIRQEIVQQMAAQAELQSEKTRNLIKTEISASMIDGWTEYRRLIMAELASLREATVSLEKRTLENGLTINGLDAGLKARAGMVGGIVAAVVAFAAVFVQALFPNN